MHVYVLAADAWFALTQALGFCLDAPALEQLLLVMGEPNHPHAHMHMHVHVHVHMHMHMHVHAHMWSARARAAPPRGVLRCTGYRV